MAMLKTDDETHTRFMHFKAQWFVYLDENLTVTEMINKLLDCGERCLQKEREDRLGGGSVPHLSDEERRAKTERAFQQDLDE